MQFAAVPTEQTTAATDAALGLVAAYWALALHRWRVRDAFKARLWTWTFALAAGGSVAGAAAHGLQVDADLATALWQVIYLSLALAVALFALGALYDACGPRIARACIVPLLAIAVAFLLGAQVVDGAFITFVLYDGTAMFLALVLYAWLALRHRAPGAAWMTAGVLVSLAAGGLQTDRAVGFRLVWPFDHNSVFHLVQIVGLLALGIGLRSALKST